MRELLKVKRCVLNSRAKDGLVFTIWKINMQMLVMHSSEYFKWAYVITTVHTASVRGGSKNNHRQKVNFRLPVTAKFAAGFKLTNRWIAAVKWSAAWGRAVWVVTDQTRETASCARDARVNTDTVPVHTAFKRPVTAVTCMMWRDGNLPCIMLL